MPDTVKCKNIVEAIRYLAPDHILCSCLNREGLAMNFQNTTPLTMPDGRTGFMCLSLGNSDLFRGEPQIYDTCKSSLYRIHDRDDRIVALTKSYEFMEFINELPEVKLYLNNNFWYEPWALAQHYGFATPMIDLTNEIAVAAFFATHKYDFVSKSYRLMKEGVGRIRCQKGTAFDPDCQKVRPIGVQPFMRPSNQYGLGYWIPENEDFAQQSISVEFDQDESVNKRLEVAMGGPETVFFPNEYISQMASVIKLENVVTNKAIKAFAEDKPYLKPQPGLDEIRDTLKRKGVFIVDAPVICPDALPPRTNAFIRQTQLVETPIYQKGKLFT